MESPSFHLFWRCYWKNCTSWQDISKFVEWSTYGLAILCVKREQAFSIEILLGGEKKPSTHNGNSFLPICHVPLKYDNRIVLNGMVFIPSQRGEWGWEGSLHHFLCTQLALMEFCYLAVKFCWSDLKIFFCGFVDFSSICVTMSLDRFLCLSRAVFFNHGNSKICGFQLPQFPSQISGNWDPHNLILPRLKNTAPEAAWILIVPATFPVSSLS